MGADTPRSVELARHDSQGTYRVGELESFYLIQVEILVSGHGVYCSRLELLQQLQVLFSEVIYCIPAF